MGPKKEHNHRSKGIPPVTIARAERLLSPPSTSPRNRTGDLSMFHASVPLLIGLLPLAWLVLAVAVRPMPRQRQPVPVVVQSFSDRDCG